MTTYYYFPTRKMSYRGDHDFEERHHYNEEWYPHRDRSHDEWGPREGRDYKWRR